MQPEITSREETQKREAYQAVDVPRHPSWHGIDADPSRRPGVPMMRADPQPMPNTIFPPERQAGSPAAPMHYRPNKEMPPVFGTSMPLRGLSGAIRRFAYSMPDHEPSHWLLLMLGDRVESWGVRARRVLPFALPLLILGYAVKRR